MDRDDFWRLVEDARAAVPDPAGADAVAAEAAALPAERPREQIVAAQRVIWQLMADSYRTDPWAAAYHINGGCSDDGFDYFRGRLILQGRAVFERAVADPDSLADLPAVRAAAQTGEELESEAALGIAWTPTAARPARTSWPARSESASPSAPPGGTSRRTSIRTGPRRGAACPASGRCTSGTTPDLALYRPRPVPIRSKATRRTRRRPRLRGRRVPAWTP
ncbi:UNVERIFIED_ORG: uncharacterized protein DUF4240 [Actinomadura viridilutea]|uniref:DUF4240 domain-containing protein n=1 Tax=Actinomadura rubrobrunea TaxID=115335 RepID=UPI000D28715D|nr:DUF4240 domain-containing protein [Actinomadura rubrobrunea]